MAKDKNKLNPLRTSHDIELEVDGLVYKVVCKSVNKTIQSTLNALKDENKIKYEDADEKRAELAENIEIKSTNDQLLQMDEAKDKAAILLENKTIIKKNAKLNKEIKALEKNLSSVNDVVENYYKKMFEQCISGEDKAKLQTCLEDNGISYSVIHIYINEAIKIASEKK